jgi:hypothetical protein
MTVSHLIDNEHGAGGIDGQLERGHLEIVQIDHTQLYGIADSRFVVAGEQVDTRILVAGSMRRNHFRQYLRRLHVCAP